MDPKLNLKIDGINYRPGNIIKGLLTLDTFSYIGANLQLSLIGEIHNNLNYIQIITFNEIYNIFETNYNYDFINNKFICLNDDTKFLINPSHRNININMLIPIINLPSTHKCKNFCILYKLSFKLKYTDISNNRKEELVLEYPINIIPNIYTFDDIYINPLIFIKKNYTIFLPYQSYIPGDLIPLYIETNNLYTNIIKIKLSLIKRIMATNLDFISEEEKIVDNNKKIIINKNNSIIKIMDLQIPYDCKYTIFSKTTDNIFEVKYFLIVNINIYKNILEKINIPIIIGSYSYNEKITENIPILPKYEI